VVRAIHARQLRAHGGRFGERAPGLVELALGGARARATDDPAADLAAIAAGLGCALARAQPFLEGSARTAFQAMYVFLGLNRLRIEAPEPQIVRVTAALGGAGQADGELAAWLRAHTVHRVPSAPRAPGRLPSPPHDRAQPTVARRTPESVGSTSSPVSPAVAILPTEALKCPPDFADPQKRTHLGGVMERSLLIVDHDPALVAVLRRFFLSHGWVVQEAAEGAEAAQLFTREHPDLVLLDLNLPALSGMRLLEVLRARDPEATVILLAGNGDIATAVEAMRLGAENFLTKPVELAHVEAAVERAYEKVDLRRRNRLLSQRRPGTEAFDLGSAPVMQEISRHVELLAESDTTVLLLGERGTGKGWVAQKIHALSPRASNPFVEINCAGLTATFLDSELFGHERGAYTDAKDLKHGLFEMANGGTLFLDEIGDLAIELQPKLLKALESRRFRRLGGTREIEMDVRVVAATNHDLEQAVAQGRFREDLHYRLNVLPLRLPPLRERGLDAIVELASRILADLRRNVGRGPSRISPDAMRALAGYGWPGNIRELRNTLERVLLLAADAQELRPEHLPPEVLRMDAVVFDGNGNMSLEEMEKRHIAAVLLHERGRVAAAARTLGISRSTLYEKMHRYHLEPPRPVQAGA
jgi:DNA-binding NtrC family response regulator/prophage maintenance system killer protein